jgi:hypothetical protein
MRCLTTNEHGQEVLVGLNVEETEFYVTYLRTRGSGRHTFTDQDPFLELREKHERAWHQVLHADNQLRIDNPPRQ